MDSVVHFEIPFSDGKRAHSFYGEVFGWKLNPMPEMRYTIAHTTEVDKKQMPKKNGAINGGMYNRKDGGSPHPVVVIDVKDIDDKMDVVKKHGGSIVFPKRKVGDMGWYCQVKDTEGNIIGLWQNIKK